VVAATVVLVHGMCGAPSAWSRVVPLLHAAGVAHVAVQLPSCEPGSNVGDAESVRLLLDEIGGPVVLAGHSFGGMVLTEIGTHESVMHLVYVDAEMLDVGEAVFDVMDGNVAEGFAACMHPPEGDRLEFDAEKLNSYFVSRGWSTQDTQEFLTGLRAQRVAASVLTPTSAAWRTVPSTFISCDDSELSVDLRSLWASRADQAMTMPGDHFPIWRRPEEVAAILAGVARAVA
jgi:pimeloyl-ACP methyl ester carboxylesterase